MSESTDESKRAVIQVYLSREHYEELKEAARKMHVSISTLARLSLNEYRENHKVYFLR